MKLRTIIVILSLLALLSTVTGGYLYFLALKDVAIDKVETEGVWHAEAIRDLFELQISTGLKAVRGLSGHKEIKQALAGQPQTALNDANQALDNFNTAFEASVSYLMDNNGNTIASSNRNDPNSFVGKNYSFRPYFQKALQGTPSVYMALGVTSGKRGVYYSQAVYREGQESPAGVIVMKTSVDAMEKALLPMRVHLPWMITLITGPQGVIFMSNVDTYLFQVLEKISNEETTAIVKSKQFGAEPPKWSGLMESGKNRMIDTSGNEFIIARKMLTSLPGWQVVHLHNIGEISKGMYTPLAGNLGSIIFALFIFIGLSVIILYKMAQKDILSRRLAEKELQKSEKRYRSIFQNRQVVMLVIDPENGQIVDANPAALAFYGWSFESFTGMNIKDINTQSPEEISNAMKVAKLENRSLLSFQHRLTDGTIRDVEVDSGPMAYGDRTLLFSIIQDVTERKKAEMALRNSEERYRSLVENQTELICRFKPDGTLVYVNDIYCRFFEIKKEELIESKWHPLPVDDDLEFIQAELRKISLVNPTVTIENRIRSGKGTIHWMQFVNSGFFDAQGNLVEIQSVGRDITERKQAEKVLQASHERFFTVLNSLDATIYVADMETYEILFMNKHMVESFGRDMTGEICWDVFRKESGPCPHCTNDKLIDKDGKPSDIYTWHDKNPITGKWYINYDRAIEWTDGRLVRLQIATDITTFKNMESQLQQAQKMESIGTLAGGIAHDFNNLLYVVMGNISLAQEDLNLDIETSENLKEAEKACIKAKELSARLITFSKGGDPVKKMMPINDLLKDMVISVLNGSNITQKISIDDDIRQVNIDEGQIKQVVRNIVVNAREAMDDNGQLTVSCENVDIAEKGYLILSQGEYIKISFKDQGCGILKENLEKIFDPYFSTKDMGVDKGQGLGLTVSYSIIQKHGGLINVDSEPQTGSIFSVYLPAFLLKEPDLQTSEEKLAAQKLVKQPATGTGKILLMDDEKAIRTFLGQVINRLGYDVETCIEGKEAVEIYKKAMESKEPYDTVILDLTNKIGMGGQETMKRLLEIDHNAKGIVITGYSSDPVVSNFRAYGFSGLLTKPATKDELNKVINEVLSPKSLNKRE